MIHVMVLAADRPGVLRRILGVYESRRYRVRSLATGAAGPAGFVRVNLVLDEPADRAHRLAAQLARLVDVAGVEVAEPSRAVGRELALVKVLLEHPARRADLLQMAQVFRARVVDVAPRSLVLEVTGDPAKLDAFLGLAREFGPVEVMRTGVAALARGSQVLAAAVVAPAGTPGPSWEPSGEEDPLPSGAGAFSPALAAGSGP
ncbi:acetolactate synthase small subunit [Thermaerobacter sp. PB12/4term]|uniref:acetolactate synthase small subunit n=1 Tax=Thermaerobacter sp. PB12/4term TaxID=2293838 RepID=UPI000E327F4D|nr:acetolactate synthase small subunit [Thermaerobacter sp. PB12/4term]QIA27613.1 acetolactate synthase small subunit [Thermaerobacter sp. PB12/4term]